MINIFLSFVMRIGKVAKHVGSKLEQFGQRGSYEVFLTLDAIQINDARQKHLASLGLELENRSVLEVGAGIGLHTYFFEERGCRVLSTDARPENVAEIQRRYPHREVKVLNIDAINDLRDLGMFDVIYCYGLLYHLANPAKALSALAEICHQVILLETCVSPGWDVDCPTITEDDGTKNQAFSGQGCRPTRPWVMEKLREYYGHAYVSRTQPRHVDFDLDWMNSVSKKNHRAVFVGSKQPLDVPTLLDYLPQYQVFDGT